MLPWDEMYIYDARLQSVEREFEVLSSDGLKLMATLAWRFRVIPEHLGELHKYAGPGVRRDALGQQSAPRPRRDCDLSSGGYLHQPSLGNPEPNIRISAL